jgi:hypothetical protein
MAGLNTASQENRNGESQEMRQGWKEIFFRIFVSFSFMASVWTSAVYAQQPPSYMHEEREDHRQEDVVHNMHFADDVLKNKFLDIYVPYQERLFKIDHGYRDLIKEYLAVQSNGQVISGPHARALLDRGLKLQHERNENLSGYIAKVEKYLPGGVALQAWLVESKLHAASASVYLAEVPFVTQ